MSPRWATTGVFVVNGAAIGTWVAQIPWIQDRFDLSRSAMGLVITGMAIAVILAFPIAGQAIVRHGSERIVWVGGIATALAVNLPVLAPARRGRRGRAVRAGRGLGDPGRRDEQPRREGGARPPQADHVVAARGLGVSAAWPAPGSPPRATGPAWTRGSPSRSPPALLLALLFVSARAIGHGSTAEGEDAPSFALPSRGVVLLAILCLLVMVTEGAMADWGGLYLRQDLGASAALAALAYSFFTGGMTVGRVVGDWVNDRIGAVALLRWGALLTGIPLAAMLLIGHPAAALVGLFLVGLGVANGVPLMFSAAGRQPDTPPGPGIAAVSSMGSLGFLAGPPVIGFLADAISLPWALATLILGAVVVFALARRATGRTEPAPARVPDSAQPELERSVR
jgi:fucose permease